MHAVESLALTQCLSLLGAVQHYLERLPLFIAVLDFDQSLPVLHILAASLMDLGI